MRFEHLREGVETEVGVIFVLGMRRMVEATLV